MGYYSATWMDGSKPPIEHFLGPMSKLGTHLGTVSHLKDTLRLLIICLLFALPAISRYILQQEAGFLPPLRMICVLMCSFC